MFQIKKNWCITFVRPPPAILCTSFCLSNTNIFIIYVLPQLKRDMKWNRISFLPYESLLCVPALGSDTGPTYSNGKSSFSLSHTLFRSFFLSLLELCYNSLYNHNHHMKYKNNSSCQRLNFNTSMSLTILKKSDRQKLKLKIHFVNGSSIVYCQLSVQIVSTNRIKEWAGINQFKNTQWIFIQFK